MRTTQPHTQRRERERETMVLFKLNCKVFIIQVFIIQMSVPEVSADDVQYNTCIYMASARCFDSFERLTPLLNFVERRGLAEFTRVQSSVSISISAHVHFTSFCRVAVLQ